jgi:1,4-alpha-glucan branching enzyme
MSIQKEYLTDEGVGLVKFCLPPDPDNSSKKVYVVGDFNDWNHGLTPMKKGEDGSYFAVVALKIGHEYQFRYLIDETQWENDSEADKQVLSPFQDSENSVVVV